MSGRDDDLIQGRQSDAPKPKDDSMTTDDAIRARQKSRALVMAVLLGAFVILIFAISIVKMVPAAQ